MHFYMQHARSLRNLSGLGHGPLWLHLDELRSTTPNVSYMNKSANQGLRFVTFAWNSAQPLDIEFAYMSYQHYKMWPWVVVRVFVQMVLTFATIVLAAKWFLEVHKVVVERVWMIEYYCGLDCVLVVFLLRRLCGWIGCVSDGWRLVGKPLFVYHVCMVICII